MTSEDKKQIIDFACKLYADGSISKEEFLRRVNQQTDTANQVNSPDQEAVACLTAAMNRKTKLIHGEPQETEISAQIDTANQVNSPDQEAVECLTAAMNNRVRRG